MASAARADARLKPPAWKRFPGRDIAWRIRKKQDQAAHVPQGGSTL